MAKKYRNFKKKKNTGDKIEETAPQRPRRREYTPQEKEERRRLFYFLVFWCVFLSTIYYTCIRLEFYPIMHIYTVGGALMFLLFVFFNGGVRRTTPDDLKKPDYMGYDEFELVLKKFKKRRLTAKYCFAAFVPFPMIMGIDYTIMVWAEKLAK